MALGYNALVDASNQITLGDSSITTLRCAVTTITSLSDARDKKDIAPLKTMSGITFVDKLNPVDFVWNMRDGGKVGIPAQGFIAQELLVALEGKNYVDGIVQQGGEYMSVAYQNIIPLLTKAIQELSAKVETLEAQLQGK
jgi:hypothetical protein